MDISKVRKKLKKLKAGGEKEDKKTIKEKRKADTQKDKEAKKDKGLDQAVGDVLKTEETGTINIVKEEEIEQVKDIELIEFKVANEEYAVRLSDMQEIMRFQSITSVPRSPEYLQGVTFLRGKLLPVINLRKRLGLDGDNGGRQKIMVLSSLRAPVGILVSSVLDVLRIPETELLKPPSTLNEKERSFIAGVVKSDEKFISVLSVDNIVKIEIK
jgi:purine-binding chemotaxis protein CheW